MFINYNYKPIIEDYSEKKELTAPALLKLLENAGAYHSEKAGDPILDGKKNGHVWILTEWLLDIAEYPKQNEELTVTTWSRGPVSALTTEREFELLAGGKLCVKARSNWVILNAETGRPMKLSDDLLSNYQPEAKTNFADFAENKKNSRIEIPEAFSSETAIKLRRSDIDFNQHVHNLTYLDFALEALPAAVYQNAAFKKIRITYKTALKYDEQCICKYACQTQTSPATKQHTICIYNGQSTLNAIIQLTE